MQLAVDHQHRAGLRGEVAAEGVRPRIGGHDPRRAVLHAKHAVRQHPEVARPLAADHVADLLAVLDVEPHGRAVGVIHARVHGEDDPALGLVLQPLECADLLSVGRVEIGANGVAGLRLADRVAGVLEREIAAVGQCVTRDEAESGCKRRPSPGRGAHRRSRTCGAHRRACRRSRRGGSGFRGRI